MPEVFTKGELDLFRVAAANITQDDVLFSNQINIASAAQLNNYITMANAAIAATQAQVDALDATFAAAKQAKLDQLNATLDIYNSAKTKFQNLLG